MLKKNNQWQATLLSPTELGKFLNQGSDLAFVMETLHATFQVNKIEDARKFIKFPLSPHRKTVYDVILTA